MDGKVKRLRKGRDGEYTFEIIEDIATFVDPPAPAGTTQEEKDSDISKRFKS
jgi:hypothetical protein